MIYSIKYLDYSAQWRCFIPLSPSDNAFGGKTVKKLLFAAGCILLLSMLCMFAAATQTDVTVKNGGDHTSMLDPAAESFVLRTFPTLENAADTVSLHADARFPSGVQAYSVHDSAAPDATTYGLLAYDGSVLLQPQYRGIYMLERCRGEVGAVTEREDLANFLVLIDENYSFRIFRCTGDTPQLLSGSYDLIGSLGWDVVRELDAVSRAASIRSANSFFENFIPVYQDGKGYGLLDFDGELLLDCAYERYAIVAPNRIAMYGTDSGDESFCDVYDQSGTLVFSGAYQTLHPYSEGLAAAEKTDGSICYIAMNGSSAFTLHSYHMPPVSGPASFSDALVLVRGSTNTEAPALGDKYFAYLDSSGNELISLRDFEEDYGAAPEYCGAFKDGVALLRDEYDEAYALLSSGEIRKLKYSPMFGSFGVGGFAIVDTDGDGCGDNLMDKWGRLLYAGDYAVRCCCSSLSHADCQWVAVTELASDLTSYFNLKTRCRTGFLYTDSESRIAAEYAGKTYLPVMRDGGLGVLGEDAKEVVPAVYEAVIFPEGRRAYFMAKRTVAPYGYSVPRVSLYDFDGNLLAAKDEIDDTFGASHADAESGYGYYYYNYDADFRILTSDGELIAVQKDCYVMNNARFSSGLMQAEYTYYVDGESGEDTHHYGFLTEKGDFVFLADAKNNTLPFDFGGTTVVLKYGAYSFEADDTTYILSFKNWSYDGFLKPDQPAGEATVKLVSAAPADGKNHVFKGTDTITLQFNQDILLQDVSAIDLRCDLGEMPFHASARGDTLYIYPEKHFYTGEIYTLTLDGSAISAGNSSAAVSSFEGENLQFKIAGVSSKLLLTYYPEYLIQPESIGFIYQNSAATVEKLVDAYGGKNGSREVLASFFYAKNHLTELGANCLFDLFGGESTKEKWQNATLDMFVSKACADSAASLNDEEFAAIKNYIQFCRDWKSLGYGISISEGIENGLFETAARESGSIDPLRDTLDTLTKEDMNIILNFCTSHAKAIEGAWKANEKLTTMQDKTLDELMGEYSLTLYTYVHMNRSAVNSLLRHLSEDSELYAGLTKRAEMLSSAFLSEYLQNQLAMGVLSKVVDESADLLLEKVGNSLMRKVDFVINMAEKYYKSVTGNCDVDKYVQTIMMSSYADSVAAAQNDVLLDMMLSVREDGQTTRKQRTDLKVLISTNQQTRALLMEMASELVGSEELLTRDCLTWKQEILEKCGNAEYLELCKLAAAHLASEEVFPTQQTLMSFEEEEYDGFVPIPIPETEEVSTGRPETELLLTSVAANDVYADMEDIRSVIIEGNGVVGEGAFAGCTQLTSVLLGGVTEIGSRAFADCALTTITIPESLTFIASDAFEGTPVTRVAGTTEVARAFAEELGAEYQDLNTRDVLVLRAGYDTDGKQLYVCLADEACPELDAEREMLYFLDPQSYLPVCPSL